MTAPINNNLRNLSQASVRSRVDSGRNDAPRATSQSAESALTTGRADETSVSASASSAQHNIDWFSDLDAGSKLPIVASDRYSGHSIDDIAADIQRYLGFIR